MKNSFLGIILSLGMVFFNGCGVSGDEGISTPFTDTDGDGITDNIDNCINDANANQDDEDNDGIGDVCDSINNNITPPSTPSNLSAFSGLTECQIAVSWVDTSNNEDNFILVRTYDVNGITSGQTETFTRPPSTGTGSTVNFTDTIFSGVINVSYVVRARNVGGSSADSISSPVIVAPLCDD